MYIYVQVAENDKWLPVALKKIEDTDFAIKISIMYKFREFAFMRFSHGFRDCEN